MSDDPAQSPAIGLLSWVEACGGRFPRVAPRRIPGMGLGLVATHSLATEEELLFVPRDVWLTRKTAHTSHREVLDTVQALSLPVDSMCLLTLLVALEHETPASFFHTYLHGLGERTVPYELTPQERAAVQGLPLAAWIDEQCAGIDGERAAICSALRSRFPDVVRALDGALWRWAYGHVMQRTFTVDVEDEEVWVLVPGMDLCNHADEPNARFFAEDEGWYLEASRPIAPGEQITIRYGRAKTSADLLLYYGFVTPDNPSDRLHLTLELAEDDPDQAQKRAAIDLLGLRTDVLVGPEGAIPSAFLHAAILWGLDSAAFRAEQPGVEDPALASAALAHIANAIEAALTAFPTTPEEDVHALENAPSSGWLHALVSYRLNAKRLHGRVAAGVRRRIADIAGSGWRPDQLVVDDPDGRYGLTTVRVRL